MAEIIRGKITDPLYMITNTNEQTMQFRLNGDEILVFPKALEANKQRLEKAFRTGKTISIKITEGATYRIFRGFAENPAKQKKAQVKRAFQLLRILESLDDAELMHPFFYRIYEALDKEFDSLPTNITNNCMRAMLSYDRDKYEGKWWLYQRNYQVYLRHDNINDIPF